MTTLETLKQYHTNLKAKTEWQNSFSEEVLFTNLASPPRSIQGKASFLQATQKFYATIADLEIRKLVIDGENAMALVHYRLQPPNGMPGFDSDVAEIYVVRDGKIAEFSICFDTSPYPK